MRSRLPPGVDGWGYSLRGMMLMVTAFGFLIAATYWWMNRAVLPKVRGQAIVARVVGVGVGVFFWFEH